MAPAEQDHLLRILRERDIPLTGDDIAWAFTTSRTRDSAEAFVREYLHPSTLLTKDELDFCNRQGVLASDQLSSHGRPLSDAEFEAAIEALDASTAAIERQSRVLQSQREALHEIQVRNASASHTGADGRRKKIARENAQLDFEIDELSQEARNRIASASKQTEAATSSLPSQIERLLEKDDRLLDGLQKLLPKVSEVMSDSEEAASVEQLCSALASISIKEIQKRLDRAYREGVTEYYRQQPGTTAKRLTEQQQKQSETLRAELRELSGEIEGLVGIVVDHQYRKPLQQSQTAALVDSQTQRTKWSGYTISALAYLTSRLDAINEHVQRLHAHGAALRTVSATLEDIVTIQTQHAKQNIAAVTPLQTPDRNSAKGLKPLRLVQANLSEGQDPSMQFLRQHEVRLSDLDHLARLGDTLAKTLREREARMSNLSRSNEHSLTDIIMQSLGQVDAQVQDLLQAVYAHSTSKTIKLVDHQVQAGIGSLESATQKLGDEMRELDVDAIARALTASQTEVV